MTIALRLAVVLLLVLLLVASPAHAAVLWFSGWETGSVTEGGMTEVGVGGGGGGAVHCTASNLSPMSGGWKLGCASGITGLTTWSYIKSTTAPLSGTTLGARIRLLAVQAANAGFLRFETTPLSGTFIQIGWTADANRKLYWSHNNATPIATSGGYTASSLHLIDVKVVIDASVGGVEAKVDGVVVFTSFGTNTSDLAAFDNFSVGFHAYEGNFNNAYDDLMFCSGGYCPPGRTIARQGTSGSSTYTAWTLNSCTGGTIDGCWSDTPFNATSNATSSTASDAQTMLVHLFNTTQAGHGSETITATDVVNACKTVMVAKTAAPSAVSIRRRFGGINTDTAKTLTVADAEYDDGIWSTSVGNLLSGTPEIGVVHGAGADLDTVEDMWLACDYRPASVVRHRVTQD